MMTRKSRDNSFIPWQFGAQSQSAKCKIIKLQTACEHTWLAVAHEDLTTLLMWQKIKKSQYMPKLISTPSIALWAECSDGDCALMFSVSLTPPPVYLQPLTGNTSHAFRYKWGKVPRSPCRHLAPRLANVLTAEDNSRTKIYTIQKYYNTIKV